MSDPENWMEKISVVAGAVAEKIARPDPGVLVLEDDGDVLIKAEGMELRLSPKGAVELIQVIRRVVVKISPRVLRHK